MLASLRDYTQGNTLIAVACPRRLWTHDENNKLVAEHYAWCRLTFCFKQSAFKQGKATAGHALTLLLALCITPTYANSGLGQQGIGCRLPRG